MGYGACIVDLQPADMRSSYPWMLEAISISSGRVNTQEDTLLTTYAVSAKFVIKLSIGTGFLDSNLNPKTSKSFWRTGWMIHHIKQTDNYIPKLWGKTET